jgi:hypothetical protein
MQKVCINEINSVAAKSLFNDALTKKDPLLCDKLVDVNAIKRCKEIVGK